MPEITNPQVVAFANNRVRPIADKLIRARRDLQAVVEEYTDQNVGSLIDAAGDGNLIADGSATDGRPRLAGGDIYNLITLLQDLDTFFNAGRVTVIDKAMGNGG
jgi:hypothetical protein